MKSYSLSLIFTLIISLPVFNQWSLTDEQKEKISAITKRDVPDNAPGVAFGLVKNGEIIYTQFEGYADLKKEVLINEQTRFNIASNAKQFTAIAILKLSEEGLLNLTDDIRQHFPELLPDVKHPILIQHLLTHTSGVRDFYDLMDIQNITWWKHTLNNQQIMELLLQQRDLNFEPGTEYLYSNSNYVILAELIGKTTGLPFTNYMNTMFQSLGMRDTSFEPNHKNIRGPIANPYFNFKTWTGYEWLWDGVGDGNLFTTLKDQLVWERIVQTLDSETISSSLLEQSQQRIFDHFDYGFGLEFSTFRDQKITFHHGGTGAWKATFMRFPAQNISLITFSNSGKTDVVDQNQRIADIIMGTDQEPPSFPTTPPAGGAQITDEELLGVYVMPSGYFFRFIKKQGHLYLAREGRNDIQLERVSSNVLREVNDPAFQQEFTRTKNGDLKVTAYYTQHFPFSLTKVEGDFSGFDPKSLQGKYKNDETGAVLFIGKEENRRYKIKLNGHKTDAMLLTPNRMLANSYQARFDLSKKEKGLYLDGGRVKNIYFRKVE